MDKNHKIQIFNGQKVRTAWNEDEEKWYFSIVDVVAVLTDSANPQTYWRVLKKRLKEEGNETVTNCNALKMLAADGKMRKTDVAALGRNLGRGLFLYYIPALRPSLKKSDSKCPGYGRNVVSLHYESITNDEQIING